MTQQQKRAWYMLIVTIVTACLVGGFYPVLGEVALAFLALSGLWGFEGFFFGPKKGVVTWDEREAQINSRANLIAFAGVWIFLTLACMVPWLILHGRQVTIPVNQLPLFLWAAAGVMLTTRSIAILVQYGRERSDGKN